MKTLLLIAMVFLSGVLPAQVIDRNDIVITAGGGLTGNLYTTTDSSGNTYKEDGMLGINLHARIEYAFGRSFGASLNFAYTDLVSEEIAETDKSTILDFGAAINYHVPWALRRFDLTAFAGFGYSKFRLTSKSTINEEYNASGVVVMAGINPRFYFSDAQKLGLGLWYNFSLYNYPEATYKSNLDPVYTFSFKGTGHAFGMGLFYKI